MLLKFRRTMMTVSNTCTMLAVGAAFLPTMIIPNLGGGGPGWGPALAALFFGGVIMAPITVPLLVVGTLCDVVGYTKTLREEDKKNKK